MDSIENLISYTSPARLMIKIWEFSHHFFHSTADESFDCQCEKYLNMCIDAARDSWDNEIIYILTLPYTIFSFIEKNMSV